MQTVARTIRSAATAALRITYRAAAWMLPLAAGVIMIAIAIGPRTGAYRTLTVLTGSMRPAIPPGSMVAVVPVPAGSLRVGDVITFNAPIDGAPVVTHRIAEIVEAGNAPVVRTKGDANESADPWLARIEGGTVWKVRLSIPVAGRAIAALRSPKARPLLLYALPAVLGLWWLAEIWRPVRRRRCSVVARRGGMPRCAPMIARATHG